MTDEDHLLWAVISALLTRLIAAEQDLDTAAIVIDNLRASRGRPT